jgi:hypothetical protein
LLVIGISEWFMNIIINSSLPSEASRLPEFLHIVIGMVIVQAVLGEITYEEETQPISLEACIE